jgi:hypothetical protein
MRRAVRRVALAAAALAVLLACAGAANGRAGDVFTGSRLEVASTTYAGQTSVGVEVALGNPDSGQIATAAHVDVTIATGFTLDLSGAPGTRVASVAALAVAPTGGGDPDLFLGDVAAEDATTYGADPAAQACAPGTHAAYWLASLESLVAGTKITLPIAVDAAATPDGKTSYSLHYCPFAAPTPASPAGLAIVTSFLSFNKLGIPATPGTYQWSAIVTPATPTLTPDPTTAFELRGDLPVPETLSLHVRYVAKDHAAVLSGRLLAQGQPRAGASVSISRSSDLGGSPIVTTTHADGTFAAQEYVARTEQFSATVDSASGPCATPSTAPGGCRDESLSGASSLTAVLVLPRKTDPKQSFRLGDQAVARRSIVTAADVPGSQLLGDAPPPCEGFAPDVHRLTETGDQRSSILLTADGNVEVYTTASLFGTVADATRDSTAVGQLAGTRCEANDFAGFQGHISSLHKLALPKIGNEVHAYRAVVVGDQQPTIIVDVLVVRVARAVLTLHIAGVTTSNGLELSLARKLAARAHQTR